MDVEEDNVEKNTRLMNSERFEQSVQCQYTVSTVFKAKQSLLDGSNHTVAYCFGQILSSEMAIVSKLMYLTLGHILKL